MTGHKISIVPGEKALQELVHRSCNFLSRICAPAADELGITLAEHVKAWRTRNTARLLTDAEDIVKASAIPDPQIHPRIAMRILEDGSWIEDDDVRLLWSNLFAVSCDSNTVDDRNLPFCDLLSQLTCDDARALLVVCERARVKVINGLPVTKYGLLPETTCDDLMREAGIVNLDCLDFALDHLRHIGLIEGGIDPPDVDVDVAPTAVALRLFAKVKGWRGSAGDYFLSHNPHPDDEDEETDVASFVDPSDIE